MVTVGQCIRKGRAFLNGRWFRQNRSMWTSLYTLFGWLVVANTTSQETEARETFSEMMSQREKQSAQAWLESPFSRLSRDYFSRFVRDPDGTLAEGEVSIDGTWGVASPKDADPLTDLMVGHFAEFMQQRMGLVLFRRAIEDPYPGLGAHRANPGENQDSPQSPKSVVFLPSGGGDPEVPESYTISVQPREIRVAGRDPEGLRDGVVKLVDRIGFRRAPILSLGEMTYRPRLAVRLGKVPKDGSYRDLVFMGYNAVITGYHSLYALSRSEAIPPLVALRQPDSLHAALEEAKKARKYGLKTYLHLDTKHKFGEDAPVFREHPDIRGTQTWKADGLYTLCTEHPLGQRYLSESIEGIFGADPDLDGVMIIIGGEGFYHCFMRPYGVEKGHTSCKRCEKLGAETVVSNLCNRLAEAARRASPKAEVIVWPYSAAAVWSADKDQVGFIDRLQPGVAVLTEIEKDEVLSKEDGVHKLLWDYSIDLVGPGQRAKHQIEACREAGLPIYLKSEPELAFEASGLPQIPCMDRWWDRAEALASSGVDGAWVFPYFRPCYGTSAAEVAKFVWWDPAPDKDETLGRLAVRLAGELAGPHLRNAWRHVSDAIAHSPEIPPYFCGPHYLGPAHPMCASPTAALPEVFFGQFRFYKEISYTEAMKPRPTFVTVPTGNVPVFGKFYRRMERELRQAVEEMETARALVPERYGLTFDAEDAPIRWFFHTARTQANFYESCLLRDRLLGFAERERRTPDEIENAQSAYDRWRAVLVDEKDNAAESLSVMQSDVRLDFYYAEEHAFAHGADMIRAKLELIDRELAVFLPVLAKRCGLRANALQN